MTSGPVPPAGEHRLLLVAGLHRDDDVARVALRHWARGRDLDALDGTSLRLLPLLGPRLADVAALDAGLAARVGTTIRYSWLRGQAILAGSRPALGALAGAGVEVLAVKGAALAARPGGSLGHRPMDDVDLLVRPADVPAAARALLGIGADCRLGPWLSGPRWGEVVDAVHAAAFVLDGGVEVDLHWRGGPARRHPDVEAARWRSARPGAVAGVDVLVPAPVEAALLAVEHGSGPSPDPPVRWVPDLRAILAEGIDGDELRRRAVELRLGRTTGRALRLLGEIAGDLPADLVGPARRIGRRPPTVGEVVRGRVGQAAEAGRVVEQALALARPRSPARAARSLVRHAAPVVAAVRPWPAANVAAAVGPPDWGRPLEAVDEVAGHRRLGRGWSTPEPGERWTDGPLAEVHLPVVALGGARAVVLRLRALVPSPVAVRLGSVVTHVEVPPDPVDVELPLAGWTAPASSSATLRLLLRPASPADLGLGPDQRRLGVALLAVGPVS